MKLFQKKALLMLLVGGMATSVSAQTKITGVSGQTNIWSLEDCINYALEHNISVKQSENNAAIAGENLRQANGAFYPTANASIGQRHSFGLGINPVTNARENRNVRSNDFSLSSSVTLFNGFRLQNAKKGSEVDFLASQLDVEKMKNDISMNVALAYLQMLFNKELVLVAQRQLSTTKIQIDRMKELVEAGSVAKGNLLDVESQYAAEEQQLVNAKNQFDIARLNLMQLLELDTSTDFEIGVGANVLEVGGLLYNEPSEVYGKALKTQPQIEAAELRVTSAEYDLKQAKGNRLPSLTMGAGISSFFANNAFENMLLRENLIPIGDQLSDNRNYFFNFNLSIPIFNNFQVSSSIARSMINVENSKLQSLQEKRNLQKNIEQAYADAKAALKQYNAAEKAVTAFQESFSYMQERYNLGMVNTYEYTDAKNRFMKAESDKLQAKYDYVFKVRILEFYANNQLKL